MLDIHDFWLFVLSGLLLNLTPGVDTLYVLSSSLARGFKGGFIASLGIGMGCLVHVVAATVGLSAILMASATTFMVVKTIGALYLAYLGVKLILLRSTPSLVEKSATRSLRVIFWQGFLTNVLNPKVALFFLAFLPQFVDAQGSHKVLSMLFLGAVFTFNGVLWSIFLAWSATTFTHKLQRHALIMAWFYKIIGALFIYLGVRLWLQKA